MKAALSSLTELRARDFQAWAELADHAAEPNAFMHPDYVRLAAAALRPRALGILHCEDAGGWAACLPVVPVRARRDLLGPGIATWLHAYCYAGTPLVAAAVVGEGLRGLLDGARGRRATGFLACDWVRSGPVGDRLVTVTQPVVTEEFSRGFVRRPAPPERAVVAGVSGRRAKDLRRQQRRLAEALGGELAMVERRDIRAAAEDFLKLEAAGWKGREGTAMACNPRHAAFLVAVCEAFARRDAVQLLSLQGGGRVAAMQCNLRARNGILCMKVAYDEELAAHSPGMQLEVASLKLFEQDQRSEWMDSCAQPDSELINRLWPQQTSLRTLILPTGPAGRASTRATATVLSMARQARRRILRRREA